MWIKLAKTIIKYRWIFFVVILSITAGMFLLGRNVTLSYRMAEVLPHSDTAYTDYQDFRKRFGEEANMVVMAVSDPSFFKVEHLKHWQKFELAIKSIPKVNWILSPTTTQAINVNREDTTFAYKKVFDQEITSQAQADSLQNVIRKIKFYDGALWNTEKNSYSLLASLDKEVIHTKERKELIAAIQTEVHKFEEETKLNVHLSGLPFIRTDSMVRTEKEVLLFVGLAALITSIILFLFFKSFWVILVALTEVGIGIVWSRGLMGIMDYDITTLTGLIPPLMIVIGIPNAVYMITKYQQEYLKYGNKVRALTRVLQKTGKAIFLTNLTTAIGFGTLIITGSKILVEFGIVASITILLLFILSVTWVTIMFSFFPAPKVKHTKHITSTRANFYINFLTNLATNHRPITFVVAICLFIISIIGMFKILPSGKVTDDIPKKSETYKDLAYFEENYGGVMPFEIVIDVGKDRNVQKSPKLIKLISKLQDSIAVHPEFSRPVSFIELLKYANQGLNGDKIEMYMLPSQNDLGVIGRFLKNTQRKLELQNVSQNKTTKVKTDSLMSSYMDTTGRFVRIRTQMKDMGTYEIKNLQKRIRLASNRIFEGENVNVVFTGASVVMLKGTEYLVKNLFSSIICAILLIAVIMAIMFRNFRMVFISLLPNILPLVFTAGVMGFSGIPLKASTCIIFSIAFGISVDDTIHYLAKYQQDLKHFKGDIHKSVISSLKETGLSMTYTSIVLFFGFGIFVFSEFGGTIALGMLVSVTLIVAMFTNLTLLPALLISLQGKKIDKDFDKYESIEADDEETDIEESKESNI